METLKSQVELMLNVVTATIVDLYALPKMSLLTKKQDYQKEAQYLRTRVMQEGLPFLTTKLPQLGEYLDARWLKGQDVSPPEGFSLHNGFPSFLRPLWVYLTENLPHGGSSEEDRRSYAYTVRIARTLLYGLKKLEVPYTPSQEQERLQNFLGIEQDMDAEFIPQDDTYLIKELLTEVFSDLDLSDLKTKHGPGAVAGGERGNGKWQFNCYFRSTHKRFPLYDWFWRINSLTSPGERSHRIELASHAADYRKISWSDTPCARLLLVPKDSRGPRVIACEPKELMYLQQGVCDKLVKRIERHYLTAGHVNFTDQSVNASLALSASRSGDWGTIDLSDASDRVSMSLVRSVFPDWLVDVLDALRSTEVLLPSGIKFPLKKHALMGSALCFPVESILFWAISVVALGRALGYTRASDIAKVRDKVYVYGDDIIVPDEHTLSVIRELERYGLKANLSKSLYGSHFFRESCGTDALYGYLITPLRIRRLPPRRPEDTNSIVAYVSYACNNITSNRNTVIREHITRVFDDLPRSPRPQPFLCYVDGTEYNLLDGARWSQDHCTLVRKAYVPLSRGKADTYDGYDGIGNALLLGGTQPVSSVVTSPVTLIVKRTCAINWVDGG